MFKSMQVGHKIQLAISVNIVLAILVGEYLVVGMMGLSGTKGVLVNLLINSTIAFVYGLVVSRAITQPLQQVLTILKGISSGHGDLTKRLPELTGDEVGEISRHFNRFLTKLEEVLLQVVQASDIMGASVKSFAHMDVALPLWLMKSVHWPPEHRRLRKQYQL